MRQRAVLLITDDSELTGKFREFAGNVAAKLKVAGSLREAARKMARSSFDVLFVETDSLYDDLEEFVPGRSLLSGTPPVVVFSKRGSIPHAVRAMRAGACDYLPRPPRDAGDFELAVHRALEKCDGHDPPDNGVTPLEGFITKDHRLLSVCRVAAEVADSRVVLLIEGERGTGRSFLARKVHESSNRSLGAFVELTCGSEDYDLASELFGSPGRPRMRHDCARKGKLFLADGGTLLLNEVSQAPPSLLSEVVRAVQPERGGEERGAGGKDSDVRLMMSDNITDQSVVQKLCNTFDFNGAGPVKVRLPALRDRVGDVPLLARYFANLFSTRSGRQKIRIARDAIDLLVHYPWPGNVRELKEAIGRSVLLARNGVIEADSLRLQGTGWTNGHEGGSEFKGVKPLKTALQEPEREYILAALRRTGWNKKRAAVELNVSRSTLYKKISKYRLDEVGGFSARSQGERERWVRVLEGRQFAD